jgi:hypothetical protein
MVESGKQTRKGENNMNKRNTRALARMKRVKQFVLDHAIAPAIPALTAESTALGTVITALDAASVTQEGGAGAVTGAVDTRLDVAEELRLLMSSLAKAAKRLDKETHPDVAGKMRMGGIDSYAELWTRALLFKETLAPIKQAFVDLGAPADVDEELNALITALQTAGNRKSTGLDTQVGGTLDIQAKAREGIRCVQQIDAILTQVYRKDPVMLGQWMVAKRATPYATNTPSEPEQPAPAPGSGS